MVAALLSVGSIFAGYRIERLLGVGGMGTVYLARNPDLPRSEALKVLAADLSCDPDFRARFIREADVAAGLDHPNIVSVHQRGQSEGQLWIAMQYVEGTNADEALRAVRITAARAVYIVGEIAKALDYSHQRGVVHRDVKPANFLLSQSAGSEERVLLGDFGIARALDATELTSTGSVLATFSYAAPELLAGQGFDGRADLYSLGCALFRLLTGTVPFPVNGGVAAAIAAHLHQPPPKVSDRVPGLSMEMDAVIATAMAKDPARRFASARDLAHAAAQALHERSTIGWSQQSPAPRGISYDAAQGLPEATQGWPSRQHPGGPAAVTTSPPVHGWPHSLPSAAPHRRPRRWLWAAMAAVVVAAAAIAATTMTSHPLKPTPPTITHASPSATTRQSPDEVARATLDDIIQGDDTGVTARFDPTMQSALSAQALGQAWTNYQQALGSYQSHGDPQDVQRGDLTVVNMPLQMEREPGQFRLTVHPDGTIAGLYLLRQGVAVP